MVKQRHSWDASLQAHSPPYEPSPLQMMLQPFKLTHYSLLIFNSLNSHFNLMFSYFFSILPLSKGTRSDFLSSAKFPSDVNCRAEISHFANLLLVCREWALDLGGLCACLCFSSGAGSPGLQPVQTPGAVYPRPHKELRRDGGWRQWGRGARREPEDIPEPVLLPRKRNTESYCQISEILAFGC